MNLSNLQTIEAVTKAHIAQVILDHPANKPLLIDLFGEMPNRGQFIEGVMNEGCPAYVEKYSLTPWEAADLIRQAGGKVVLAHPVAYHYEDGLTETEILALVQRISADGIEAYYVYVDRHNVKHNDSQFWRAFAERYQLLATIGSDFHQDDGLRPDIGLIDEKLRFDDFRIQVIMDKFLIRLVLKK